MKSTYDIACTTRSDALRGLEDHQTPKRDKPNKAIGISHTQRVATSGVGDFSRPKTTTRAARCAEGFRTPGPLQARGGGRDPKP